MNTPVLLITFNRPDHTHRVLQRILDTRLSNLYIFQDGARSGNVTDETKCAEVRRAIDELIDGADWQIDVHKYYSDSNLGCGPGPAAAISWFLGEVGKGIIIEDDALPASDFFGYAEQLLERYDNDDNVMAIGSMQLPGKKYGDGSYYFSKMNHTLCAWATWKRAWEKFDISLSNVTEIGLNDSLKKYGARLREREYWLARLAEIHKDGLAGSSWDQQFWMTIWMAGGKGILPNVNLCSNIGFDESATHTFDSNNLMAKTPTDRILPLVHPSSEKICRKADSDFQKNYFNPWQYGWEGFKRLPDRIHKRIKKLIK